MMICDKLPASVLSRVKWRNIVLMFGVFCKAQLIEHGNSEAVSAM
jgi:hypothetical protein